MNHPTNTILAIFAHPDDEIGAGSTLAHYSDLGVRTVLICATRGEVATIYCDDCATRETLAEVRTRELECARQHLGISELRWLDWPDGGVKDLPRAEAVGQVVQIIRELRPTVILTHPENGLYPHPDHLAVWEIVREAFDAAAEPALYPEAGPAWAASRLFTRALPQSFFERAPDLAEFRVELNGQQLPFYGTPDDEIAVSMRVSDWVARRMAAWECHRSQHNPKGFTSTMPDQMREEMAANEHYILAAARAPLPAGVHDDLLAGLEAGEGDAETPPAVIAALRDEMARHRAISELCAGYLINQDDARFAQLVRRLIGGEHEMIYRLSRALRDAGAAPGAVEADARLRRAGRRRESTPQRVTFLRSLTEEVVSLLRARRAAAPQYRSMWEELIALAQEQADAVAAFVQ